MPKGIYPRLPIDERFDRRVDRSGECHLWTGPLASTGYPNFWVDGRYLGAHVYAWTRSHGKPETGSVVRHRCRNRHCVNPAHLDIGSRRDNNRDRQRDGTQTRGSAHHTAVLTEEIVLEAMRLHRVGVPIARIARDLGYNTSTISDAVHHRHGVWRHVDL